MIAKHKESGFAGAFSRKAAFMGILILFWYTVYFVTLILRRSSVFFGIPSESGY